MIYQYLFDECKSDSDKLKAALRIFDTHIKTHIPYFKDSTTRALGVSDQTFLGNFCSLIEAAQGFSEDPTLRDSLKAALVLSLGHEISEDAQALLKTYHSQRSSDIYASESRPDGPLVFQGDWTGVFIRGDDAIHLKMEIEEAIHHIDTLEKDGDRHLYNVRRVLTNLLSNFEGVSSNDPDHNPTRLKPFEECVRGDIQEVPSVKMDAYKGEGAVTDPYAYLGIPARSLFIQD